jgi:hypothetical protein
MRSKKGSVHSSQQHLPKDKTRPNICIAGFSRVGQRRQWP